MKAYTPRTITEKLRGRRGFTLVELLVVVGIIVALAAVIIPAVTAFAGRGEEGAQAAELDSVQTAMDSMMADQGIVTVDPHDTAGDTATALWTALPVGTPLFGGGTNYLKNSTTEYFYCWDDLGNVEQHLVAEACA